MTDDGPDMDIVVAGGGPVGLYLAGLLGRMNLHVTVIEKKTKIDPHSKSLGIHPVSLELFKQSDISVRFLEKGIKIRQGFAFIDRKKIGSIDFSYCPGPYNYILALPQFHTEEILEKWIDEFESVNLIRNAEILAVDQSDQHVKVRYSKDGSEKMLNCKYLAGCDGKNSTIRKQAGIKFPGKKYPDTYLMGDFSDNTTFGSAAAVYLHRDGLIESFPLPGKMRRWVIKTDKYVESPSRNLVEALVLKRLNHNLAREGNSMISSFGVQHYLADSFHAGRVVLAGDSAHVVSPIGGQGMNLGWLTAQSLAQTLTTCLDQPAEAETELQRFSKNARSAAKKTAKRAELNMWLGRKRRFPLLRNLFARLIVNTPLQHKMARIFTMRDL